jgi:hypothetical protein
MPVYDILQTVLLGAKTHRSRVFRTFQQSGHVYCCLYLFPCRILLRLGACEEIPSLAEVLAVRPLR